MSIMPDFRFAESLKLLPVLFAVFILNTVGLFAQADRPESDPVIHAAEILATSLPNEYRIDVSAEILIARQQLQLQEIVTEGNKGIYRNIIEMAKSEKDASRRSHLFGQIVRSIVPEDVDSFDDIFNEGFDGFLLERILERCQQAGKDDLAYRIYEKAMGMQNTPEKKAGMRYYINRVCFTQIHAGKIDEALASAGRLKDPALREYVLEQISKTARQQLRQWLLSPGSSAEGHAAAKRLLQKLYPDIDASRWLDCFDETFAAMCRDAEEIEASLARFDDCLNLVHMYRRKFKLDGEYVMGADGMVVLQTRKLSSPDPTLQSLLLAMEETAKKIDRDSGTSSRTKKLAVVASLSLGNADGEAADRIVDHMLTLPGRIDDPRVRIEAMLDVIPLAYRLERTAEANAMCDEILQFSKSEEAKHHNMSTVLLRLITEKQSAGLFDEAESLIAEAPQDVTVSYRERLARGTMSGWSKYVSRLLDDGRYEDALEFIAEKPTALGDRIQLLFMVAAKYRESDDAEKCDETCEKAFELVDALVTLEAERTAAGKRSGSGMGDDRYGMRGASLAKSYSHPLVQQRRERGDLAGAVDLGRRLFMTHVPEVEILYVARAYADAGDYDSALEVGGDAAGRFGSDSGIRGYVAHAMFKNGEKAEAEKLLVETLAEIDAGRMSLHGDFIVGLLLCGKTDDAIRLSDMPVVVDVLENEQNREQTTSLLSLMLKCLLVSGREEQAMRLVDQWSSEKIKIWGIWTLICWNHEEYIDKGATSLLTPEWKKTWTTFLTHYAEELERTEADVKTRIEEWNRIAECLAELDAGEKALEVLDKASGAAQAFDMKPIDNSVTYLATDTGNLLVKLGEREKAVIAFVSAVRLCRNVERDDAKADGLKNAIREYAIAMTETNPAQIHSWSTRQRWLGRTTPLKEIWNGRLFSSYMIQ